MSWADVVTDGSLGKVESLSGNDIQIAQDLGATSGNNLFHSFQTFDLNSEQTATFNGANNIQNIISRVTGGPSSIDGTIASTIDGANLYFLNSDGIMFGANASINISGSFYATTADELIFDDGFELSTDPVSEPMLSSAEPESFGFLSAAAPISLTGSQLSVAEGQSLTLIGGNINLTNGVSNDGAENAAELTASNGQVTVVSTASPGAVKVGEDKPILDEFTDMGTISMDTEAKISTNGRSGGKIVIRGGRLIMDNSTLSANTTGQENNDARVGIDVVMVDDIELKNDTRITTYLERDAIGNANHIELQAKTIEVTDKAAVESKTMRKSIGDSGNISVNKNIDKIDSLVELNISNRGKIVSLVEGEGDSGDITINADEILMSGDASGVHPLDIKYGRTATGVFTMSGTSTGNTAGDIYIKAEKMELIAMARIRSDAMRNSNSGNIRINAKGIKLSTGAAIESIAINSENSGDISIVNSKDLSVDGVSTKKAGGKFRKQYWESRIINNAGGDIFIDADNVSVLDGAQIRTQSNSSYNQTGNITIESTNLEINGINKLVYEFHLNKNNTKELAEQKAASLLSTGVTFEVGNSNLNSNYSVGNIFLASDYVTLNNGGRILSEIVGENIIDSPASGQSGNITVEALDMLVANGATVSTKSLINNGTNSFVAAGNINFEVNHIAIENGSNIISSSNSAGDAGNINITSSKDILIKDSSISSQTYISDGGNIKINAGSIIHIDQGDVTTSVDGGTGDGGNIKIESSNVVLESSNIKANAEGGKGGNIKIEAGKLYMTPETKIEATSTKSVDGNINIISSINSESTLYTKSNLDTKPILITNSECETAIQQSSNLYISRVYPLRPENRLEKNQFISPVIGIDSEYSTSSVFPKDFDLALGGQGVSLLSSTTGCSKQI